jgi:Coenzyme PQQ synthesis protein D (PqqD)
VIGSKDHLAIRRREVAAKVIDGEAILINLSTGLYYSMGKVGGRVWSLIEQSCNSEDIASAVAAEYDVPAATARADVANLVAQLAAENLIEPTGVSGEGGGAPPLAGPTSKAAYTKPELRKFSDMAEIFAMDPPLPGLAKAAK